ncbi:hypothetical protein AMJ83_09865 [candidate division WOR_3 bacterium SM23_42]|uniref:DUF4097 domain-containing protein n=1 Tax=candidate division WOR_3 bacterium SM23_42 TaxID=1703779 RepID=A0A0S8FSM0_UNCW3|nr:MAG: hypothetical protein AMJ83_09865 [candidate division WOR_3 bacterium SM23_42]
MGKYLIMFFCVAMIATVCTQENGGAFDYNMVRTETRTWHTSEVTQIHATTVNGDMAVAALQDTLVTAEITRSCTGADSADAEAHIANIAISESINEGQLNLEADMPDDAARDYQADFDITSPQSKYVNLTTVNGDVTVNDMIDGARVVITNGGIATANLRGGFDGVIVNGTINCDMEALELGESALLVTTNGAVNLKLPADVSANFNAATTNGEVVVTGFASVTYTIDEENHKAGTIGGGGAVIDIGVVNGDITIMAR